jgi:hypothetical protein
LRKIKPLYLPLYLGYIFHLTETKKIDALSKIIRANLDDNIKWYDVRRGEWEKRGFGGVGGE